VVAVAVAAVVVTVTTLLITVVAALLSPADDSTPVEGDDNPSFSDLREGKVVSVEGGMTIPVS
jgi:hypothetical protein